MVVHQGARHGERLRAGPGPRGDAELGPAEVRFLCDRRAGIGADGLLRAVLAKHIDGWPGDGSLWFMDYRNADGSVAEMCGNGARVFARFLADQGLASGPVVPIATRSGLRETTLLPDGQVRVAMGPVAVTEAGVLVTPAGGEPLPALTVDVGNPHAVSFVDDLDRPGPGARAALGTRGRLPAGGEPGVRPLAGPPARQAPGPRARGGRDPVLRHRRGCGGRRRPRTRTGPAELPGDLPGRRTGRHGGGGADRGRRRS